MRRLYHQFYLTIIASLVMVVLAAGALWRFAPSETPADQAFEMAGELLSAHLAPAEAGLTAQQQAIDRLHARLGIDLALFANDRRLLAAAGGVVPPPPARREIGGWIYGRNGPAWAIRVPDGRWIVAKPPPRPRRPVAGVIAFLGVIALVVAICAYPLVRRLTRRLERLQVGVESLGAGDLSARVKIEGSDEVARLAESFNRSAARIEELVSAHKMLLANASHELRTPLSRIRLAIELMKNNTEPRRGAALEKDIAELDGLIEQILLSSRLEATKTVEAPEDVDLLALAAEEAARYEHCSVTGSPVVITGNRGLLQRMVRNLLDNAERHGAPPVKVDVRLQAGMAVVRVADHGAGVEPCDREHIFTPFYRTAGRSAPGAGLGLALVRQIARQHGGDAVWVEEADGARGISVSIPAPGQRPA
jgi:two-component system, OmpR family, sensor histidine kinase RstB